MAQMAHKTWSCRTPVTIHVIPLQLALHKLTLLVLRCGMAPLGPPWPPTWCTSKNHQGHACDGPDSPHDLASARIVKVMRPLAQIVPSGPDGPQFGLLVCFNSCTTKCHFYVPPTDPHKHDDDPDGEKDFTSVRNAEGDASDGTDDLIGSRNFA